MKLSFYGTLALLCALTLTLSTGCGQKMPDGFPAVYPCTVTVTDAGKPVDNVTVTLAPLDGAVSGSFTTSGTTDGSGVATLSTVWGTFAKAGAPLGSSKVVLIKQFDLVNTKTPEELSMLNATDLQNYVKECEAERDKLGKAVPEVFRNVTSTPLEITVSESGGELKVDVAEYKEADSAETAK